MAEFTSATAGGDITADSAWGAAGDIIYATDSATATVLNIGCTNAVLQVSCGLPAWTTSPTIGSTSWGNATHAHAADNSGGTIALVNIHGLTTDTIAAADFLAFSDEDEADDVSNKLTVVNLMETGLPLVTEDTVAVSTDYMVFLDGGSTGNTNKESIADFVSGIAGTNVTASSGQLSVGAAGAGLGLVIALS